MAGSNRISGTHVSFGNDFDWKSVSSYCQDFGGKMHPSEHQKIRPPSPAQVLPSPDGAHERVKWLTSTKRDFFNYGPESSHNYRQSLDEFKKVKVFHTVGHTWSVCEKLPPLTRTCQDYIPPVKHCSTSYMPKLLSRIKQKHKDNRAFKDYRGETEARFAYQWPTQQRALRSIYKAPLRVI